MTAAELCSFETAVVIIAWSSNAQALHAYIYTPPVRLDASTVARTSWKCGWRPGRPRPQKKKQAYNCFFLPLRFPSSDAGLLAEPRLARARCFVAAKRLTGDAAGAADDAMRANPSVMTHVPAHHLTPSVSSANTTEPSRPETAIFVAVFTTDPTTDPATRSARTYSARLAALASTMPTSVPARSSALR